MCDTRHYTSHTPYHSCITPHTRHHSFISPSPFKDLAHVHIHLLVSRESISASMRRKSLERRDLCLCVERRDRDVFASLCLCTYAYMSVHCINDTSRHSARSLKRPWKRCVNSKKRAPPTLMTRRRGWVVCLRRFLPKMSNRTSETATLRVMSAQQTGVC